jgi:hypothetical protein
MIDIKIGGIKYSLPTSKEISINRFVEFLEFADEKEPKQDNIDLATWLDYYAESICFWTGCPLELVRKCKVDDIYGAYMVHQKYLMPEEDSAFNCFELDGEIYYLPKRLMVDSTIEDFAEANEYEKQMNDYLAGNYRALPKIAAVICRKEGETFDSYDVEERGNMLGELMSAYDAIQVGFFLNRLSEKSAIDSQIYTTSQILAALKQESKN